MFEASGYTHGGLSAASLDTITGVFLNGIVENYASMRAGEPLQSSEWNIGGHRTFKFDLTYRWVEGRVVGFDFLVDVVCLVDLSLNLPLDLVFRRALDLTFAGLFSLVDFSSGQLLVFRSFPVGGPVFRSNSPFDRLFLSVDLSFGASRSTFLSFPSRLPRLSAGVHLNKTYGFNMGLVKKEGRKCFIRGGFFEVDTESAQLEQWMDFDLVDETPGADGKRKKVKRKYAVEVDGLFVDAQDVFGKAGHIKKASL